MTENVTFGVSSGNVVKLSRSSALSSIQSFVDLSADTEFGGYGEAQWRFLLCSNDLLCSLVLADVAGSHDKNEFGSRKGILKLMGCVLCIKLDESTVGIGMVLVNPSHRRKGYARRLIRAALGDDDVCGKRSVLAVCSELGRPVYSRLGYKKVGMVFALSCSIEDAKRAAVPLAGPIGVGRLGCARQRCSKEERDTLCQLDKMATGYDRRERIHALLADYAPDSTTTVIFGYNNEATPNAVAVSRQDCIGGPLIIGPIIGPPDAALPMLVALANDHPVRGRNVAISVLFSGHHELVEQLLGVRGMSLAWQGPAMTLDGEAIYSNGHSESYLALMHPTLG